MRIKAISNDRASVWFSRDELTFLLAATGRAIQALDPQEFSIRTTYTVDYAKEVLARLQAADAEVMLQGEEPARAQSNPVNAPAVVPADARSALEDDRHITMSIEYASSSKVLLSLSDHELCFLGDVINESIHGLDGIEEFLKATGTTRKYGDRLWDQLTDTRSKIREARVDR
jgi:hypothetical protein